MERKSDSGTAALVSLYARSYETNDPTVLNDARAKFTTPGDIPEPEIGVKPGARHQALYNLPRFVASVRRLHTAPDNPSVVLVVEATNEQIEKINTENGFPMDCGKFPLRYLQHPSG